MKRTRRLLLPLLLAAASAWPSLAASGAQPPQATEEAAGNADDDIPRVIAEAAGALVGLADGLIARGCVDSADEALAAALAIAPEIAGAHGIRDRIAARRASMPRPAAPLAAEIAPQSLYNLKNLSGWKKVKGRWDASPSGIECDPGRSDGLILVDRALEACHGFEIAFGFSIDTKDGRAAGVICGASGRNRVGVRFSPDGAALYDFKAERDLGAPSKRSFAAGPGHSVRVAVRGGSVEVFARDKSILKGRFDDWAPGDAGFYAHGRVQITQPVLIPLEVDACLQRGRGLLKARDPAGAASCFLRACETEPGSPPALGLAAAVMAELGFEEEAGRRARSFLALCGGERPQDAELRALHRTAFAIAERAGAARAELDVLLQDHAARIAAAAEAALAAGGGAHLDAAVAALRACERRGEIVEDLESRIFLARCPGGQGRPLFNGRDLAGWTRKLGAWKVGKVGKVEKVDSGDDDDAAAEEGGGAAGALGAAPGALTAVGDNVASAVESDPFPAFDRYVIETRQKGTGTYIDQGIRFFVLGEPWQLNLNRFMSRMEITLACNELPVYFYHVGEGELTSTRWHAVDCLVHMNRLTVLLDGRAIFTKVLPAAPEPRIGLFTGVQHGGHFRDVILKPLGRSDDYLQLLEKLGVPAMEIIECETLAGGEGAAAAIALEQPFAYHGFSLAGALPAAGGEGLRFRCQSVAIDDAVLSIRYAAPAPPRDGGEPADGAVLHVFVDDAGCGIPVELAPTESANDFAYARAALGALGHGRHDFRIMACGEDGAGAGARRILLDRFVVSAARDAPEEETRVVDSAAAPHFRIRTSPGAQLPDNAEEIFALLEVVRAYMVDYYGFEPADPQYYNLISRECWGDPHKGGYATGDNLYIPEETTVRDLSVIMHELSHNFDGGNGLSPPWFGEGKSYPAYLKFREDTKGKYRAFQRSAVATEVEDGRKAFEELDFQGENLFQYWGTERFPYWGALPDGRDLTSLGYRAANWFCCELADFLGDDWLKGYFALVRKDIADRTFLAFEGDRVRENSVIADYFARSSGKDAASFFCSRRFKLADIYDWEAITVECGGAEPIYLTDPGASTVTEDVPGIGACRSVSEGSFVYAFPVAPHTRRLRVAITRSGIGTCDAWDRRLFRGRVTRGTETREFELDDPGLWAGARLRLEFGCDTDDALHVAAIAIKRL